MTNTALIFYEPDHVHGNEHEQHYIKLEPGIETMMIRTCHGNTCADMTLTLEQVNTLKNFINQL